MREIEFKSAAQIPEKHTHGQSDFTTFKYGPIVSKESWMACGQSSQDVKV